MRNQPNRGTNARPYLRQVARTKTIDAGFQLGVQQPGAKEQLAAQADTPLATLIDDQVRDLRDLAWLSIDERSTKDLDQVSYADVLDDGATRLRVAIADVDAWVPQGSPLDKHAARNAVTVFTGVVTYPMFPEALSTERVSLIEGADRLALVIEMVIAPDGTVGSSAIYRALVRNHTRLDYEEASALLADDAAQSDGVSLVEQLRRHESAVLAYRDWRFSGGALNMVRAEVQPIFDDDRIIDMVVVQPNRARIMIEHLMVAVNATIAQYMSTSGLPWIARSQSPHDWDGLLDLADEYAYELPDEPDRGAYGAFVHHRRSTDIDDFETLQPVIARLLGWTEDLVMEPDEAPLPHYGLALDGYTRATAPIRRYADLLAQRLLKAAIAGQPAPYTLKELDDLVEHCREQGRAADAVEREMFKIYGTLLVQERTGEVFDATVTNTNDYGVWARIDLPPVDGRLVRADASLERGDRIRVRVTKTNWERGFIDLVLVP